MLKGTKLVVEHMKVDLRMSDVWKKGVLKGTK